MTSGTPDQHCRKGNRITNPIICHKANRLTNPKIVTRAAGSPIQHLSQGQKSYHSSHLSQGQLAHQSNISQDACNPDFLTLINPAFDINISISLITSRYTFSQHMFNYNLEYCMYYLHMFESVIWIQKCQIITQWSGEPITVPQNIYLFNSFSHQIYNLWTKPSLLSWIQRDYFKAIYTTIPFTYMFQLFLFSIHRGYTKSNINTAE